MASPARRDRLPVADHRRARHDYEILERLEAGIALTGTEVKSARAGHVSLAGGFVRFEGRRAWLCGVRIAPYEFGNRFNHDPERPRALLLHQRELAHLSGLTARKGLTVIPLSAYFRKGKFKIELGLCRGRQSPDKRELLKRKTAELEAARAVRNALR